MPPYADFEDYRSRLAKPHYRWAAPYARHGSFNLAEGIWWGDFASTFFQTNNNNAPTSDDGPWTYTSPGALTNYVDLESEAPFGEFYRPPDAILDHDHYLGRVLMNYATGSITTNLDHLFSDIGGLLLCDLLALSGAYNFVNTGVITTDLPTQPITRYTDGIGVWPVMLFISHGDPGGAWRYTYTNTNDVQREIELPNARAGGGTFSHVTQRPGFYNLPLYPGDVGVKSIDSYENDTSNSGNNWCLALVKPIVQLPLYRDRIVEWEPFENCVQMPLIKAGACLTPLVYGCFSAVDGTGLLAGGGYRLTMHMELVDA